MSKKHFSPFILVWFFIFQSVSCSKTIYNVTNSIKNPACDSTHGNLFIKIINESKIGISSLSFETDSGYVRYGGIRAGDSTCYFPITAVFNRPKYQVNILLVGFFRKITNVSFLGWGIDNIGDSKLTNGFYTLRIKLKKNRKELSVESFLISK